jgi:hypothetical protein
MEEMTKELIVMGVVLSVTGLLGSVVLFERIKRQRYYKRLLVREARREILMKIYEEKIPRVRLKPGGEGWTSLSYTSRLVVDEEGERVEMVLTCWEGRREPIFGKVGGEHKPLFDSLEDTYPDIENDLMVIRRAILA